MRIYTHWLLAVIAIVAVSQSAWADDYRYTSRAELYEAQAQQYVADRTRTVRPRTQYVQQRVIYMDTAPIRQRVIYPYNTRASIVRNPAYHTPARVTVIEDVTRNDRSYVFDDVITDDRPVEIRRTYIQPSHYAGYTGYSSYHGYNRHVAYRSFPTYYGPYAHRSYRHYPVYRSFPTYHVGVHYNDSYRRHCSRHGYGDYHRGRYGGYGHGGYGYGGYGRYGQGSNWGVSVYFDF